VGIPACDGAKVVHQKASNNIDDVGTRMTSPLTELMPPTHSRKISPTALTWTPGKKFFFDSSVDFDGEATGTSLDVQY
jgi:hypothetical protein